MRKTVLFLLSVLTALTMMTGCGSDASSAEPQPAAPSAASVQDTLSIHTIGDINAKKTGSFYERTAYDNKYVYVFEMDGVYYRATAALSGDVYQKLMALDVMDENYLNQCDEILASLPVEKLENLSEMIPSETELDQYVGKTGEDLINEGWYCIGHNLETMEFTMEDNTFRYTVVFDGTLEDSGNFDEYQAIRPLVIKSVKFAGIGDNAA